jgi:hypothetical protein
VSGSDNRAPLWWKQRRLRCAPEDPSTLLGMTMGSGGMLLPPSAVRLHGSAMVDLVEPDHHRDGGVSDVLHHLCVP